MRNPVNGVATMAVAVVPGAPSQLISRRPLESGPGVFPLGAPRVARNSSTALRIEVAVGPAAWNTNGVTNSFDVFPCADESRAGSATITERKLKAATTVVTSDFFIVMLLTISAQFGLSMTRGYQADSTR
jgi:hypothetical protein